MPIRPRWYQPKVGMPWIDSSGRILHGPGMVHRYRLSLTVALTACIAFASPPSAGQGGFSRRLWQTQDGLPEETVQAFAQTVVLGNWMSADLARRRANLTRG